jgi:hypothetical protein
MVRFGSKALHMKQYHIVSRFAIYALAVVLILLGIYHILNPRNLFIYVPPTWLGNIVWAYIVGGAFVLVGISFITNQYVKFTGYVLAVLLLFFVFAIHLPNYLNAGDLEMRQLAYVSLLKDTAIACFALHIAAGAHHQHFHLEESD